MRIIFILILLTTVTPYFSYGQSIDSIPGLALRESKIEIRKRTPAKNARLLRKLMAKKKKVKFKLWKLNSLRSGCRQPLLVMRDLKFLLT